MRSPLKNKVQKSIEVLESDAQRLLDHRYFKDAIPVLKELLKRERRPDDEDRLALAYLERSRQVAAKGMFKDAAMLWENHAQFRKPASPSPEYLDWLLKSNQTARLGQVLAAAPVNFLTSPVTAEFMESLAILGLENDKWLKSLPLDHPVVRQQPSIKAAISAYAAGEDTELRECLKTIPSRSPYRNLSLLLKSLATLSGNPDSAKAALARIEPASPCGIIGSFLTEFGAVGAELDLLLNQLPNVRVMLNKLQGYDKIQLAMMRDIRQPAQAAGKRGQVDTVLRYRSQLGDAKSQRFCFAALPGCPEAIPFYERAFGKLSLFENNRIRALHEEGKNNNPQATQYWFKCIDLLKRMDASEHQSLTLALIYRHVAGLAHGGAPRLAIECLEMGLELNPDDRDSYIDLVEWLDQAREPRTSQFWLEKALKRYPGDTELLSLGIRSALRRESFKKAVSYARSVLKKDPINSQARQCLIEAHIGHARKQIKTQRWDRAETELAAAREFDPQGRNPSLLYLEGLLEFFQADNERCRELWRDAQALQGSGVIAWLHWAMEVQSAGLSLSDAARLIKPLDTKVMLDRATLLSLVGGLERHARLSRPLLAQALAKLMPIFKRSLKQKTLSDDDLIKLCQGFADAGQYSLLAECAKQGSQRQYLAIFGYYEILAKCRGDAARLDSFSENRLRMLLDQAHFDREDRAIALIDRLLRQCEDLPLLQPDAYPFGLPFEGMDPGGFGLPIKPLENMTPEELINQALGGVDEVERIRRLPESEAMDIIMSKLVNGMGIEDLLPHAPVVNSGRKPKKRR